MADRYLIETSATDGYLLEDGSGVLLLEGGNVFTDTGTGTSGFKGSGGDVVESSETATAQATFNGSGTDIAEFSETVTGRSEFIGIGSKAVEWVESGSATAGFTASGADVIEYGEAGAGLLGFTGGGTTGSLYEPVGAAKSEFVGSGAKAVDWVETGYAAMGGLGSGVAIKTHEHVKSGSASITMVASAARIREYLKAGSGILDWKAEGFTSDRVLTKVGKVTLGLSATGGFIQTGVAGINASLLESFSVRGGLVGIPLMPPRRR